MLKDLKKEFAKIEQVSAVFLYGSYARGDFSKRHSDFDILVFVDLKKVSGKLKEKIDNKIYPLGIKNNIKIHIEYQGTEITPEDETLIAKIMQEGKLLYSSGLLVIPGKKLGLKAFFLYEFKSSVRLSQVLHGRKSWYYKGKKKIIKDYPGIINNKSIVSAGKGALLVRNDKSKDIEMMFERLKTQYKTRGIFYG